MIRPKLLDLFCGAGGAGMGYRRAGFRVTGSDIAPHVDGRRLFTRKDGSIQRAAKTLEEGGAAMGIDWMSWEDLTESIPPAYTEHIGRQLLDHIKSEVAA